MKKPNKTRQSTRHSRENKIFGNLFLILLGLAALVLFGLQQGFTKLFSYQQVHKTFVESTLGSAFVGCSCFWLISIITMMLLGLMVSQKKKILRQTEKGHHWKFEHQELKMIYLVMFCLVFLVLIFIMKSGMITGLFIGDQNWLPYNESLNLNLNSDSEYEFIINEHPEMFDLKSLKLSGTLLGNGKVNAYLEVDGERYLIFDETDIQNSELSSVTGYVVEVEETAAEQAAEEEATVEEAPKEKQKETNKEKKKEKTEKENKGKSTAETVTETDSKEVTEEDIPPAETLAAEEPLEEEAKVVEEETAEAEEEEIIEEIEEEVNETVAEPVETINETIELPVETIENNTLESNTTTETIENITSTPAETTPETNVTATNVTATNLTEETTPEITIPLNQTTNTTKKKQAVKVNLKDKNGKAIGSYKVTKKENKYDLEVGTTTTGKVNLQGLHQLTSELKIKTGQPKRQALKTKVIALSSITLDQATVTLPKTANQTITTIYHCSDFDFDNFTCSNWEKTDLNFTDYGEYIEFNVTSFSAYAGGLEEGIAELISDINAIEEEVVADTTENNVDISLVDGMLDLNSTSSTVVDITLDSTSSSGGGAGFTINITPELEVNLTINETEELEGNITLKPQTHYVNITYDGFEPEVLNLNTGDTVVWTNQRGERTPRLAMIVGARMQYRHIRSPEFGPEESWSWKFNQPGTFIFVDGIDTTLDSKVIVTGEPLEEKLSLELAFHDLCSGTCLLPEGINTTALKLIFEVGEGTELNIKELWYALEDLTPPPLDIEFNLLDNNNDNIPAQIELPQLNQTIKSGTPLNLEINYYDLLITPEESLFNKLTINDLHLTENKNAIIKLYHELPVVEAVQSYAVEELIPFNTTTLTLTAQGNNLYRCADWNFLWKSCNGDFTLEKTIFPNESYTITIDSSTAFIETLENISNVTYLKVKEDPRYDAIIDSSLIDENNNLIVVFHHDSPEPLPISIIGRITNYTLDKNTSGAGENVTLTVPEFNKKKFFRIRVGSHSEVFEFGEPEQFSLQTEIKDSHNQSLNFTLELEDAITAETVLNEAGGEKLVDESVYDVKIKPENNPIKEINFQEIELFDNVSFPLKVEDTSEDNTSFTEIYSLDPSGINFTNATVTVTAKGTSLYKCKDWNFTTQTCSGNWTLFKSDLIKGQDYTFTLTPADPGFAESGEHCYAVHGAYENIANHGWARTFDPVDFAISDVGNRFKSEYKWKGDGQGWETAPDNNSWNIMNDKSAGAYIGTESYFFTDIYSNNTLISGTIYISVESKDKGSDGQLNWTLYEYNPSDGSLVHTLGSQVWDGTGADDPIDSELNITNHTVTAGNRLMLTVRGKLDDYTAFTTKNNELKFKVDEAGTETATPTTTNLCSNIHNTYKSFLVMVLTEEISTAPALNETVDLTNLTIQNANRELLNFSLEVEDSGNSEVKCNRGQAKKNNCTGLSINSSNDIKIKPSNMKIKEVYIPGYVINENKGKLVDLDDTPEAGFNFDEVFAINPVADDLPNFNVTVTATSTSVYKCQEWNFTTRTCSGSWVLYADNLIPGQNYTIIINGTDPGFGEINITNAVHLDQNHGFLADVYEEVSTQDGLWAEPIYHNEYIRATFETNLTNGNVINLYLKDNQSLNTSLELYEENGSTLLGTVSDFAATGQYDITIANMVGSNTVFDFKVVNAQNDSNAYLLFDYVHDEPGPNQTCYAVHGAYENITNHGMARTFDNVTFAIADVANLFKSEYKWKGDGTGWETAPDNNSWNIMNDKSAGAYIGTESYFFTDIYSNNTLISGTIYISVESKDKGSDGQLNWTLYEYDPSDGILVHTLGSQVWDGTGADDPIDSELNITDHTVTAGNRLMLKVVGKLDDYTTFTTTNDELKFKLDEAGIETATTVTTNYCSNIHNTYKSFLVMVLTEEIVESTTVYGNLNVSLINPLAGQTTNVTQNQTFWINATVYCDGEANATCGNVSAYARYNTTLEGTSLSQWASGTSCSSEYGSGWDCTDMIGAPQVSSCSDNTNAWASTGGTSDGAQLNLTYDTSVYATGVALNENFGDGFISKIEFEADDNTITTVWEGSDTTTCFGWLNVSFAQTAKLGKKIILTTNGAAGDYEEIDAVQLIGNLPSSEIIRPINTTTGANPFFTTFAQPQSCVINKSESCTFSWNVNTTGTVGVQHNINVNFSSDESQVADNETLNATVNIIGEAACTPNMTNTSWSTWSNLTCSGDQMNQSRSRTEYDQNSCGEIENTTYYGYQLVGPTFQNTSWSAWTNLSCLITDFVNQSRNLTQYDLYGCAANSTFTEYQATESCDYCTPSWSEINTSCQATDNITGWYNDTNACYALTGLASDNNAPANNTYACDYCSYSITNTSWTDWADQGVCLVNDTQLQNRSLIEYDANYNSCYAVTGLASDLWNSGLNNTYWDYNYTSCDYCTPSWSEINTSCQATDNITGWYNDTNACYALTGLASDNNAPANNTYACDYCSYSITNTSWTDWADQGVCLVNDTQLQNRSLIEYDANYNSCYAVTGLASDLWNSGLNNTYWEEQTTSCKYCSADIQGPFNTSCNSTDQLVQYYTDNNYNSCCAITSISADCAFDNGSYANQTLACDFDGPPGISFLSPTSTNYTTSTITINISSSGASSIWFYNGTTNETYSSPINRIFADGTHTLTAYANDTYSNLNTTSVTFDVDTTPPAKITSLNVLNSGTDFIYWIWSNPSTPDFSYTEVWINGVNIVNTSNAYYYATSLSEATLYTISTRTVDRHGNINTTWVNRTDQTGATCNEDWQVLYQACQQDDTRFKYYNDTNACNTTVNLPGDNGTYASCDYIVSTEFGGTDFTTANLSAISNLLLSTSFGRINFSETISISRSLDLDNNIQISTNLISLNSSVLPELNKSAILTLTGLSFVNPIILKDGSTCPASICTELSYSGGNLTFNVTHFTTYSATEGPYCGDSSCNNGESCSSCVADCGSCSPGGGGGGGSSGRSSVVSIPQEEICKESWVCTEWNACTTNKQTRTCTDENDCGTTTFQPNELKGCGVTCEEKWACAEWSPCQDNTQVRVCKDANNCQTDINKPVETQSCQLEAATAPTGKESQLTGRTIEILPEQKINTWFALPSVFLIIILIVIASLKKTKLSPRTRKLLLVAHVGLIILILFSLILSFGSNITGLASLEIPAEQSDTGKTVSLIISGALTTIIFGFFAIQLARRLNKNKKRKKNERRNKKKNLSH